MLTIGKAQGCLLLLLCNHVSVWIFSNKNTSQQLVSVGVLHDRNQQLGPGWGIQLLPQVRT